MLFFRGEGQREIRTSGKNPKNISDVIYAWPLKSQLKSLKKIAAGVSTELRLQPWNAVPGGHGYSLKMLSEKNAVGVSTELRLQSLKKIAVGLEI